MMLLKFSGQEKFSKELMEGKLHLTAYGYFRPSENKDLKEGQGDRLEGTIKIGSNNIESLNLNVKDRPDVMEGLRGGDDILEIWNEEFDKIPVFCCARVSADHFKPISDANIFKLNVDIDRMKEAFGEYVVCIYDVNEFQRRIDTACKKEHIAYVGRSIDYKFKKDNPNEYMYKIATSNLDVMFYKDEAFSYQNEWRLVIDKRVDESYKLDIGSISDIAILLETDKLHELQIKATNKVIL